MTSRRSSSGSPSQWYATLEPRPASTWRSTQLKQTFSSPPTNHFAYGGSHSSSRSHGVNQLSRSFASRSQKASNGSS